MDRRLLLLAWIAFGAALAGAASGDPTERQVEGGVLYARYCPACHGPDADGRGPVADVLRQPPTDLRRLGERYGAPLPADRIARFIDGRDRVTAHGTSEMPIWGERFRVPEPEASGREPAIDPRIRAMVEWLATIQRSRR
jgi:mono/diheme cytochrome c family protein